MKKKLRQVMALLLAVMLTVAPELVSAAEFTEFSDISVESAEEFSDTADEELSFEEDPAVDETDTGSDEDAFSEEVVEITDSEESSDDENDDGEIIVEDDSEEDSEEESEEVIFEDESGAEALFSAGIELSGSGSEDDPYLLSTEADLQKLAQESQTQSLKGYYRLENDIVLAEDWQVIAADSAKPFAGYLDGQNFTISNLNCTVEKGYAGLIGANKGTIRNLHVQGTVETANDSGLIAGYNEGTIENCHAEGSVTCAGVGGGIVGRNDEKGVLTQCTSSAEVSGSSGEKGGLSGANIGVIRYSGSTGNVSAGNASAGGISGDNYGTIENCYSRGAVDGSGYTGGAVGYERGTVKYSYASGLVKGNAGAGLIGYHYNNDKVWFSYYNSVNTGNKTGIPATLAQLKSASTYSGWDFEHIWSMDEKGYPAIDLRGEPEKTPFDGDGSAENPYQITTEAQLLALAAGELSLNSKNYYILKNDIALTCINWTPIGGNSSVSFKGVFDGAGHTISGLKISGRDEPDWGLFGVKEGEIRNLTVEGNVEGSNEAGLFVGNNKGLIENCHAKGSIEGSGTHGGFVGINSENGRIENSTSSVSVSGTTTTGGFAGDNYGTIRYAMAKGNVTCTDSGYTGGLVGYNRGLVENCGSQGKVTGNGVVGGLVGSNYRATIRYSYASGMVNSNEGAGLVGNRYEDALRFSYFNNANTGNRNGIPVSTAKMKTESTYTGWDFEHVWVMEEGGYPYISLRGEAGEIEITGDGSEENPYKITTEAQLLALTEGRLSLNGKNYYALKNDITLTVGDWTPIGGNGTDSFQGVFDGEGHTISGLKISGNNNADNGLFGVNEGEIRNLTAEGSVEGANETGLFVGNNKGVIEGCHAKGSVEGSGTHGGFAGINSENGRIENSTASVSVSGTTTTGGFAGDNYGTIRYAMAKGNVTCTDSGYTGGLVGYNRGLVENCGSQGEVTAGNGAVGGLVGSNYRATIRYSYASGMVNSNKGAGLVGGRYNDVIRFSYFNSANTGNRDGIPVSAAKLKTESTYTGWDFEHVWMIEEGGYPYISLRGEAGEIEISGDGSEENPYEITTEAQLQALTEGKLPLSGKNYYALKNDITLTVGDWTPIGGNGTDSFQGVFDGEGHTISGLKISGNNNTDNGLFGENEGEIRNLTAEGSVEGANETGLLVGNNKGLIEDCHARGSVEGSGTHGGFAGVNSDSGRIENSTASVSVSGTGTTGGFAGDNYGTIRYAMSKGNVTCTDSGYTGGLVGYNRGLVENCTGQGKVTGNGAVGGLVGNNYRATVNYSYASGMVNSNKGAGLVGSRYNDVIRFSYFNSANTGNREGIPASVAKLKAESTYTGWDFEHVWTIEEGAYPYISLRGEAGEIEITGDGSEENPYEITTEAQLFALTAGKLPLKGKFFYALKNDITLTSGNWTPIGGNGTDSFQGVFDGEGHTVSGLKISGRNESDTGLFGVNEGEIMNLTVEGTVEANFSAGLLVGNNNGIVKNCHSNGKVETNGSAGGLIGYNVESGSVTDSSSNAAVSGAYTGGLIGENRGSVQKSRATGKVTGTSYTGGFAGINKGSITDCYARGNADSSGSAGGFVGDNYRGTIIRSYSTGMPNSGKGKGFCAGSAGTIENSYYCSTTSHCSDTGQGEPLARTEMKKLQNYAGWDFEQIWGIYPTVNDGFPFFIAELGETGQEEQTFWYEAKERRKGYALFDQDMNIYLKAEGESVKYQLLYREDGTVKKADIDAAYSEEKEAFAGTFHINENVQEISELSAVVTEKDGTEKTVVFGHSYQYQMPLQIEGIISAKLPSDIRQSKKATMSLTNEKGRKLWTSAVSEEGNTEINGIPGGTYNVEIYGGDRKLAEEKNVTVTQGKILEIDFTEIPSIASVQAEFYADGKKVTEGEASLNFYDRTPGKSRIFEKGTSLEFLSDGDVIGYSISLTREAQKKYRIDKTVYEKTLSAGTNVMRIELDPFHTTDAKIHVTNKISGNGLGGVQVTAAQKLNSLYSVQTSGTTDSNGNVVLQIVDEEATVTFSRKSYTTVQKTFALADLQAGAELAMEGMKGMIEFNLEYHTSQLISEQEEKTETGMRPDSIVLENKKTGKEQRLALGDWPIVYTDSTDWKEGDEFSATIYKDGYVTLTSVASVNVYGNLYFEDTLNEYGALKIMADWEAGLTSGYNEFALYNEDGERCKLVSTKNKSLTMSGLPAGSYTLAAAERSVGISRYTELKELENDSTLEGQWTSVKADIEDGIIQETDITIPAKADTERLLNEDESSISVNNEYARIGDSIYVRAKYVFNDINAGSKTAVLTVPEGTRIIDGSVTVNGELTNVSVTDGQFTVSTNDKELLVRYSVKILSSVSVTNLSFAGSVNYRKDQTYYTELLGKASVQLNELTILAPARTNYTKLNISGVAPKNSAIQIFDGDILIGMTTSNKYGAYRAEVNLVSRGRNKVHRLKAVLPETGKESETVKVLYGSNVPVLLQFDVKCNAHEEVVYSVKDPSQGVGNITFTYNPAYPVTFVARFDDNQAVTMVTTVVTMTDGTTKELEMTYDEVSDCWSVTVKFNSREMPNGFEVNYLPLKFNLETDEEEHENPLEEVKGDLSTDNREEDGSYGYETLITLNDANHSQVLSCVEVEENIEFTPDDTYSRALMLDTVPYYFKNDVTTEQRNGNTYEFTDIYIQNADGSFSRYRRGVGIPGTQSYSSMQRASRKSQAENDIKALETIMKKIYDVENTEIEVSNEYEYALMLQDILQAAKEANVPMADSYYTQLELVKLCDKSLNVNEFCKDVIKTEEKWGYNKAGSGPFGKLWSYVTGGYHNDKLNIDIDGMTDYECSMIDAMDTLGKRTSNSMLNKIARTMFKDPEMRDFLNGEGKYADYKYKGKDSLLSRFLKIKAAYAKTILDPSGYVYETFEENRLEGVTTELYYENDEGNMEFWDAEEYNQINPQITDSDGSYGWDVPEGNWQVVYSKDGYETTRSDKLEVPPPQLDVNIGMVSVNGASISGQSSNYNRVELTFDKYIQTASLTEDKFTVTKDGQQYPVSVNVKAEDAKEYEDSEVTKNVELILKSGRLKEGSYQIKIASGLTTYAGIVSSAMDTQFMVASSEEEETSYTVTIPEKVTVMRGEETLKTGDTVYRNDRLLITAQAGTMETLESLTVNGEAFESGSYFTVMDKNVLIDVSFTEMQKVYQVLFDSRGGSAVQTAEVKEGEKLQKPEDPVKKYCIFAGWFRDENCTVAWDFDTDTVNENQTVYAKWRDASYNVKIKNTEKELYVGESLQAVVTVESESKDTPEITWKSSDEKIASVTAGGKITARKVGDVDIQAYISGQKEAAAVLKLSIVKHVQKLTGTDVYTKKYGDTGFYLDVDLDEGDGDLSYSSSDAFVAKVSSTGRVNLRGVGTAVITVTASETAAYGEAEKQIMVQVEKGEQVISCENEYKGLIGAPNLRLAAYLDEGDGELSYSVEDTEILTVDKSGRIESKAAGTTVVHITASETELYKEAVKDVTVTIEPIPVCDHDYRKAEETAPTCTEEGSVRYTCSKCGESYTESIAALGHNYGAWKTVRKATAVAEGEQQSSCSRCGDIQKKKISKLTPVLVTNVTAIPLKVKQSTSAVKVTKMQTGDSIKSWTSSNSAVATVNAAGKITAKKKGTAYITVTLKSGISKKIKVTVQKGDVAASKITLSATKLSLKKGKSAKLTYTVLPLTCIQKAVFTSSNENVVTVSGAGVVKAKKKGNAKITVQIGKKKVVCNVVVK